VLDRQTSTSHPSGPALVNPWTANTPKKTKTGCEKDHNFPLVCEKKIAPTPLLLSLLDIAPERSYASSPDLLYRRPVDGVASRLPTTRSRWASFAGTTSEQVGAHTAFVARALFSSIFLFSCLSNDCFVALALFCFFFSIIRLLLLLVPFFLLYYYFPVYLGSNDCFVALALFCFFFSIIRLLLLLVSISLSS
jgi:hypothetical protein